MRYSWRWYGPNDPVKISDVMQTGANEIVTTLHDIPTGEIKTVPEIKKRQREVEWDSENNVPTGLTWTIVESVPVHEDIKLRTGNYKKYIENYKQSIVNFAKCGIKIIVYNFMPILEWTRTDLQYKLPSGAKALKYDEVLIAVFDIYILQRKGAENSHSEDIKLKASKYFSNMPEDEIFELTDTIIRGLPGTDSSFTLDKFKDILKKYDNVDNDILKKNHTAFLNDVIPVAEANGVVLAIHPDDPPKTILGLPRIMSTMEDIDFLMESNKSISNGLNLCTGSFGINPDINFEKIITKYGHRIHFVHLRAVKREGLNFFEDEHLLGDTNLFSIIKAILEEEKRRKIVGEGDLEIPIRPDHGHQMLDDLTKKVNPGYSCIGRMKGLSEIRGMAVGIKNMLEPPK